MVVSVSGMKMLNPSPYERRSHDPQDCRSHDSLELTGLAGHDQRALLGILARFLGRNLKRNAGHLTRSCGPGRREKVVC